MDRREFLQAFSASMAGPAVASSARNADWFRYPCDADDAQSHAEVPDITPEAIRIGVIGIGGTGCNVLSSLALCSRKQGHSIAIDTDSTSLSSCHANRKILVGNGRNLPLQSSVARLLASQVRNEIGTATAGLDMVFMVYGMSGAAGLGISTVVAEVLDDQNILTVGIPLGTFAFERERRMQFALSQVRGRLHRVSTMLPIYPSEQLLLREGTAVTYKQIESLGATLIAQLTRSMKNAVSLDSLVWLAPAELPEVISGEGCSAFGFGSSKGPKGEEVATRLAIDHPLLGQARVQVASRVFLFIEGATQTLRVKHEARISRLLRAYISEDATLIPVATYNNQLANDQFHVGILVGGIEASAFDPGQQAMRF